MTTQLNNKDTHLYLQHALQLAGLTKREIHNIEFYDHTEDYAKMLAYTKQNTEAPTITLYPSLTTFGKTASSHKFIKANYKDDSDADFGRRMIQAYQMGSDPNHLCIQLKDGRILTADLTANTGDIS